MCRDGVGRDCRTRLDRVDGKTLLVDFHEHAALKTCAGADAAALDGLGGVPAGSGVAAVHQGVSGHDGGIGGAAADDDVGTVLEGLFVGLCTQQCHNGAAFVEGLLGDFRCAVQSGDLALAVLGFQGLRILLRVDAGDFLVDASFLTNLTDELVGHVHALVGAAGACGTDGHGDVIGAGVGRTGIAGNNVGLHGKACFKGFFGAVQADRTIGNEHFHAFHRFSSCWRNNRFVSWFLT